MAEEIIIVDRQGTSARKVRVTDQGELVVATNSSGSSNVTITAVGNLGTNTPARIEYGPATVGTIIAGFKSFSIYNSGVTDALVDGVAFAPGIVENYTAELGKDLGALSFDTQLTTLVVTTIA